MKLSDHFDSREFACHDGCGFDKVDLLLIHVLEDVRAFFNVPVQINSGCRCEKHNKAVGGEVNSQHLLGTAADISLKGVLPEKVYVYLDNKYKDQFGIGLYKSWVHIDVRLKRSRWKG